LVEAEVETILQKGEKKKPPYPLQEAEIEPGKTARNRLF